MQQCSAALIFINRPHYMLRFGSDMNALRWFSTKIYCIWKSWRDRYTFNVLAVKLSRHMKVVAAPVAWNVKVVASGARALWGKCAVLSWKVFLATWLPRGAPATVRLSRESRQLLFLRYESSNLILYKELSSSIFQSLSVSLSVRHR